MQYHLLVMVLAETLSNTWVDLINLRLFKSAESTAILSSHTLSDFTIVTLHH